MEKDARLSVAMELEYFISQVVLPLQLENVTVTYTVQKSLRFPMTVSITSTRVSVQSPDYIEQQSILALMMHSTTRM